MEIGLKVVYNVTNPVGYRVESLDVLCNECLNPEYFPLDESKMYRIIAMSYLANGGDGFNMVRDNKQNHR